MPGSESDDLALALVHEGWDHLRRQRPIAAWASWRRALRIEPEQEAATKALEVLSSTGDLPLAARVEYRFLTPLDPERRARWDGLFQSRDLGELPVAAATFAELADEDPLDARARFNEGICLAWMGRNVESVAALDRAVRGLADHKPQVASDAWLLAEILRQGGGAEALSDELNHVAIVTWTLGETDPARFLDARDDLRLMPDPVDPETGLPRLAESRVYEWLDGREGDRSRRVRALVIRSARVLRLSSPDLEGLEEVLDEVREQAGSRMSEVIRESTPIPLAFLDAELWSIRLAADLDGQERDQLNRTAVERYYESTWIRRRRKGLDGRSPLEASRAALAGDTVATAKLTAIVQLREQLGTRPSTTLLYQGYPFDRLRRRLGLDPTHPEAVDPADPTCMSGPELDELDPESLHDLALGDAFESAAALGDDRRTARFAAVLTRRPTTALARLDLPALFATLVRVAVVEADVEAALRWLDQAEATDLALHAGRDRRKFVTWRAEVFARFGQADAAAKVYRSLLAESPRDPTLALDAAETLLDNGFDEPAREFARIALDRATEAGAVEVARRAEELV